MSWDGEVVNQEKLLTVQQEKRVMEMMKVLRDTMNLAQVLDIKIAASKKDYTYAKALFQEFTHKEQSAINIAPSKGGIFTTQERTIAKYGRLKP